MLCRLVTVGIVAHVCHLHFCYFMDAIAVVAVVIYRRNYEYGVKHRDKLLASAHGIFQTVHIMEYRPGVVPSIALGEGSAPFIRTERLLECAVKIATSHEVMRPVEYILPVVRSVLPLVDFFLRSAEFLCKLTYAPVVVCIFKSSCHAFVYTYIIWYVADAVVVFVSESSGRIDCRMDIFSAVHNAII